MITVVVPEVIAVGLVRRAAARSVVHRSTAASASLPVLGNELQLDNRTIMHCLDEGIVQCLVDVRHVPKVSPRDDIVQTQTAPTPYDYSGTVDGVIDRATTDRSMCNTAALTTSAAVGAWVSLMKVRERASNGGSWPPRLHRCPRARGRPEPITMTTGGYIPDTEPMLNKPEALTMMIRRADPRQSMAGGG